VYPLQIENIPEHQSLALEESLCSGLTVFVFIKEQTATILSAVQRRKNEIGKRLFLKEFGTLTLRMPALYLLFFSSSLFQSFRSAASTGLFRKTRWTGIRPILSPARVNKLLVYPRAIADNPVVRDRRSSFK
jgi:hypothetical protein